MLYLAPFAEEMHKSRRMAALQARRFAAAGYHVLQPDLSGCGDSWGDFGDASWSLWRDDAISALDWLETKAGGPITLWGLRTGAALATDIACTDARVSQLLLWQPVANGEQFINQFLRIKLAAEMLGEGRAQASTKDLIARLEGGEPIEIGGYMLAPAMARELRTVKLASARPRCPVSWFEVGAEDRAGLMPASQRIADDWLQSGIDLKTRTVRGDPFWLTQEITECPALVEASFQVLAP